MVKLLHSHNKLALFFQKEGMEAVMIRYDLFESLVKVIESLDELLEDIEISEKYRDRFNAPHTEFSPVEEPISEYLQNIVQQTKETKNES